MKNLNLFTGLLISWNKVYHFSRYLQSEFPCIYTPRHKSFGTFFCHEINPPTYIMSDLKEPSGSRDHKCRKDLMTNVFYKFYNLAYNKN